MRSRVDRRVAPAQSHLSALRDQWVVAEIRMRRVIAPARGLYKLTNADGTACNGGNGAWPLPNGKPGAWLRVKPPVIPCEHGIHLCRASNLIHSWTGPTLWLAE